MSYATDIALAVQDPKLLEDLYQKARQSGKAGEFAAEIAGQHAASPDNVLLAAWYYRLQPATAAESQERRINWRLAISLSLVLSLIYIVVMDSRFDIGQGMPTLALLWAPAAACLLIVFLTLAANWPRRKLWLILGVLAVTAYVIWMVAGHSLNYQLRDLMTIHLPILAWVAVGLCILGLKLDDRNRFAFILKSAEVVLTGGIFFGATEVFIAITTGLFAALGINFSDPIMRAIFSGAAGLIPVLAVATVYDPELPPAEQRFDQGLAKLISTLGRIFLPFTLIVAVIYTLYIPANFMRPFEQRDVLIVYNAMLFAVMGLIVIATPLNADDVSEKWQKWLRMGLVALAILTVLVSLYALSATVYRTMLGGLTMNRLTIIGWNTINIALLCCYLWCQWRSGMAQWLTAAHRTFRIGMAAYSVWALFLLLAVPLIFG